MEATHMQTAHRLKSVHLHSAKAHAAPYLLKTSLGMRMCCSSRPQAFSWSMNSADTINSFSTSTGGPPYKITQKTLMSMQLCSPLAKMPTLTELIFGIISLHSQSKQPFCYSNDNFCLTTRGQNKQMTSDIFSAKTVMCVCGVLDLHY